LDKALADLSEDELFEFLNVVKKVEASLRLAFGTTMFNWSCYMNHSYRESPPNPHIHWWAVPRYDHAVHFGDTLFDDPHFGNPYDHYRMMNTPKALRLQILEEIKSHLPSAL
jgi:diadenosine tetraphosphate (Ap4A) HIT family hydrolase